MNRRPVQRCLPCVRFSFPTCRFEKNQRRLTSNLAMMCLENQGVVSKNRRKQYGYAVPDGVFDSIEQQTGRLLSDSEEASSSESLLLPIRFGDLQTMQAVVPGAFRLFPALQQRWVKVVDFNTQRPAHAQRVLRLGPPHRQ